MNYNFFYRHRYVIFLKRAEDLERRGTLEYACSCTDSFPGSGGLSGTDLITRLGTPDMLKWISPTAHRKKIASVQVHICIGFRVCTD